MTKRFDSESELGDLFPNVVGGDKVYGNWILALRQRHDSRRIDDGPFADNQQTRDIGVSKQNCEATLRRGEWAAQSERELLARRHRLLVGKACTDHQALSIRIGEHCDIGPGSEPDQQGSQGRRSPDR